MKKQIYWIIEPSKNTGELISQCLTDSGISENKIRRINNYDDALRRLSRLKSQQNIVISETILPDKKGRKMCSSGLLNILNEKGINTVILSSNYGLGINREIEDLVSKGVRFIEKNSYVLGDEGKFLEYVLPEYYPKEDLVA